jgi:flagellar motor switch protein FliN
MTEAVVYEQFDEAGQPTGSEPPDADLRRLSDVPMELSVEIGRTRMTVGETLELRAGSLVTLDRLAGEPVDLLVNGTPIARGEVVVVDEQFGLRVTQIVESDPGAGPGLEDPPSADDPPAADEQSADAS